MTTTFLTFLMSDNLFLHDVCSCFLVFVLKKCPVLPVSCEIKKRLIQMGGGVGGLIVKCRGRSQIQILVKRLEGHYKMIFRVKSNFLLQLSTIEHNRVTFQHLIHTFGELKLKILPQKCILYLLSKLTTWISFENITFRASLWDVYKMFLGRCGKTYNFETANSLVFQAHIW